MNAILFVANLILVAISTFMVGQTLTALAFHPALAVGFWFATAAYELIYQYVLSGAIITKKRSFRGAVVVFIVFRMACTILYGTYSSQSMFVESGKDSAPLLQKRLQSAEKDEASLRLGMANLNTKASNYLREYDRFTYRISENLKLQDVTISNINAATNSMDMTEDKNMFSVLIGTTFAWLIRLIFFSMFASILEMGFYFTHWRGKWLKFEGGSDEKIPEKSEAGNKDMDCPAEDKRLEEVMRERAGESKSISGEDVPSKGVEQDEDAVGRYTKSENIEFLKASINELKPFIDSLFYEVPFGTRLHGDDYIKEQTGLPLITCKRFRAILKTLRGESGFMFKGSQGTFSCNHTGEYVYDSIRMMLARY